MRIALFADNAYGWCGRFRFRSGGVGARGRRLVGYEGVNGSGTFLIMGLLVGIYKRGLKGRLST